MKSNPIELIEQEEIIEKLRKHGFEELVTALLESESKVYTKKGRLNKSGACRVLGCKTKELEDALEQCKEVLKNDFDL